MALYSTTTRRRIAAVIVFLGLLFLPACLQAIDQGFYVSFASRVLIMALAATSLNLVIGFGGMVSFGHAAFFGTGAYAVTILSAAGSNSAMVNWPIAAIAAAILALAIGAISLRTRGAYFIMITLAFAQMAYYLIVSLKVTGGDDGMPLAQRSSLSTLDLADDTNFYYVALAVLSLALFLLDRLAHSRFGRVIQSIRENEIRMEALGYPVYSFKLVCFVIGGALAGLAGAVMVNQSGLASPSLLHWMQSGLLMVMIVIGGVGSVFGGVVGAVFLLLCEEFFAELLPHWQIGLGLALLTVVLWAPLGIAGLFGWGRSRE